MLVSIKTLSFLHFYNVALKGTLLKESIVIVIKDVK
jgi:hypothetical protein